MSSQQSRYDPGASSANEIMGPPSLSLARHHPCRPARTLTTTLTTTTAARHLSTDARVSLPSTPGDPLCWLGPAPPRQGAPVRPLRRRDLRPHRYGPVALRPGNPALADIVQRCFDEHAHAEIDPQLGVCRVPATVPCTRHGRHSSGALADTLAGQNLRHRVRANASRQRACACRHAAARESARSALNLTSLQRHYWPQDQSFADRGRWQWPHDRVLAQRVVR